MILKEKPPREHDLSSQPDEPPFITTTDRGAISEGTYRDICPFPEMGHSAVTMKPNTYEAICGECSGCEGYFDYYFDNPCDAFRGKEIAPWAWKGEWFGDYVCWYV